MSVPEQKLQFDDPQPGGDSAGAADRRAAPQAVGQPPAEGGSLAAWLELVCRMVPGIQYAYALIERPRHPTRCDTALWPADARVEADVDAIVARLATADMPLIVQRTADGHHLVGRALELEAQRTGALVLKVPVLKGSQKKTLRQLLEWSEAWLRLLGERRLAAADGIAPAQRVSAAGLAETSLSTAASAMAGVIAVAMGAERAWVGLLDRAELRLIAMSQTATFDAGGHLSHSVRAAMEEALDEAATISYPATEDALPGAGRAHQQLCESQSSAGVCSVVLRHGGRPLGAVTAERSRGSAFAADDVAFMETLAAAAAPILELRQAAESSAWRRAVQTATRVYREFTAADRSGRRLAVLTPLALLVIVLFTDADYRVAAPATLEGRVHRTLIAPIDGYIAEAPARAGDALRAGDLLAVLDTRALEFERRKWANEQAEIETAYRQAVAKLDRAEVKVLEARLGKAKSQLALVDEQLGRARITAPFNGLVIAGDLSRSMGAPVTRGDVLFEMAPLDDYRVALEVDEHDIGDVAPGQSGHLALTALPGERLPFVVDKVIEAAETADGRNVFRVEAHLDDHRSLLRPGMHGIGKITVGERRRWWVWTHELAERVRLWLWSRAP